MAYAAERDGLYQALKTQKGGPLRARLKYKRENMLFDCYWPNKLSAIVGRWLA